MFKLKELSPNTSCALLKNIFSLLDIFGGDFGVLLAFMISLNPRMSYQWIWNRIRSNTSNNIELNKTKVRPRSRSFLDQGDYKEMEEFESSGTSWGQFVALQEQQDPEVTANQSILAQ